MQWQPRSMIAPPPVSRPSQNQARVRPGCVSRDRTQVTSPIAPARDRGDRLERLGRVAQVLEIAAEDARPPRPSRASAAPPRRSARAASCTGPPCRPSPRARPPPRGGSSAGRRRRRRCRGGRSRPPGRSVDFGDAPALAERLRRARRCASRRPARGRGRAGRGACSCRSRRSGPVPSIVIAWPFIDPPRSASASPSTRSRPATRARSLARRRPARGLAEAAVGDERQPLRRDAGGEHRVDPLGDVVGRLEVGVLDVDDAGGDVPAGGGDLAEDRDLGHLAVGELEHELVDIGTRASRRGPADRSAAPAAGRGSCRSRGGRRAAPRPTTGSTAALNSAAKSAGASGWMAGEGSSIWMNVGAGRDQALELRPEDRHERLGRGVALAVDLARAVGQPARQRVRPGQRHLERPRRARSRRSGTPRRRRGRRARRSARGPRSDAAGRGRRHPSRRSGGSARTPVRCAVELGGEEAGPAHLAVADDVDAGLLLVAQGEVDGVVEHLVEIGRPELAALGGGDPGHEPRRAGRASRRRWCRSSAHALPPIDLRERERPSRIRHEQAVPDRRVESGASISGR